MLILKIPQLLVPPEVLLCSYPKSSPPLPTLPRRHLLIYKSFPEIPRQNSPNSPLCPAHIITTAKHLLFVETCFYILTLLQFSIGTALQDAYGPLHFTDDLELREVPKVTQLGDWRVSDPKLEQQTHNAGLCPYTFPHPPHPHWVIGGLALYSFTFASSAPSWYLVNTDGNDS